MPNSPQKTTLLCLHGWGTDRGYFEALQNSLPLQNFEIITFDWPGFGASPKLEKPWTLEDYANYLADFIAKNKIENYILLGHSFGGAVAIKAIGSGKINPAKLILSGASGRRRTTVRIQLFKFMAKIGKSVLSVWPLSIIQSRGRSLLYRAARVHDFLDAKEENLKATFKNVVGEDLSHYFDKITVPTLLLWGSDDNFTPLADARFMQSKMPGSQLEVIPGGRHNILKTHAAVCVEKIGGFIK
ncbi:MAG: alpha/beta hydrolase family protein [Parcubacteria group bacterium Gr01-1014_18]|nr:MAG: alpha/beta hydrolase family protein [Parcubacteria group bacterium Greene0416_36]TSC81413.1 MAG: alpha/beta hydrolase family protein [Parcubacteria group bacterium Gr01-1014_18]TSC99011.1 MAG: alpha/beta hydrolase family protein [Parcubacteria group bacterium Greene1014_20]TSD07308.1 MAG: alpha/beta hydrolase family protein [Parcubacteria group bacterium Greene0714_2]